MVYFLYFNFYSILVIFVFGCFVVSFGTTSQPNYLGCGCVYVIVFIIFMALTHMFFGFCFVFLFAQNIMKAQLGHIYLGSMFSLPFAKSTQVFIIE